MEVGTCGPKMKKRATIIDSKLTAENFGPKTKRYFHVRATIIDMKVTCVEMNTTSTQDGGFRD